MSKGTLYVISAPSGAGKTTLVKELTVQMHDLVVSVSHTTRTMRPGEIEGVHYHFVDIATFESMIEGGNFLEYAQVFDNYYGTSQQHVVEQLEQGHDVILEIDWQGADQIRKQFAECKSIFILPPDKKELRSRLAGRDTDSEEIIERRMRDAENEMSHYGEFDYLVVNDNFDIALDELRSIIVGNRLVIEKQQQRLESLLDNLLN